MTTKDLLDSLEFIVALEVIVIDRQGLYGLHVIGICFTLYAIVTDCHDRMHEENEVTNEEV